MDETILNIFNTDEQTVLSEIDKELLKKLNDLPTVLAVDEERMGGLVDE